MVKCCCDDSVTKNIPKLVFTGMLPFTVYVVIVGRYKSRTGSTRIDDLNKNSSYCCMPRSWIEAILIQISDPSSSGLTFVPACFCVSVFVYHGTFKGNLWQKIFLLFSETCCTTAIRPDKFTIAAPHLGNGLDFFSVIAVTFQRPFGIFTFCTPRVGKSTSRAHVMKCITL